MKKGALIALILIVMAILLIPLILIKGCSPKQPSPSGSRTIRVQMPDGKIETMALEEYILGVLAAEMPASFEKEALKAQAIAARTYALRRIEESREKKDQNHPEADVCTTVHCQAWISKSEMMKKWGMIHYLANRCKLEDAVKDTEGKILVYEGRLIDPVFHSSCGGRTEDAKEVWGGDLPYLKSVDCPWDEGDKYKGLENPIPISQLDAKLGTKIRTLGAARRPSAVKILSKTAGGRVKEIKVGDKTFSGVEFRNLLGLRSTDITLKWEGNSLNIITQGNGHGVGLCQYGANGAAKAGLNYEEILKHYYPGVEIGKIEDQ